MNASRKEYRRVVAVTCLILVYCLGGSPHAVHGQDRSFFWGTELAPLPSDEDFQLDWFGFDTTDFEAIFASRVRLYVCCLMAWVTRTVNLADDQRLACQTALQQTVDQIVDRRETYDVGGFSGFHPLHFVAVGNDIDAAFGEILQQPGVFTALQRRQLEQALGARQQQLLQDNLQGVVSRIDRELMLSAAQVDVLRTVAGDYLDLRNASFNVPFASHGEQPQSRGSEQPLTSLLVVSRLAGMWTEHQAQSVAALFNERHSREVHLRPFGTGAERDRVLDEISASGSERCLRAVRLQLDLFQAERLISESQAASFDIWAKRRVNTYLSQWRDQAVRNAGARNLPPVTTAVSSSLSWKVHRQLAVPQLGEFERKRRANAKARLAQFMVGLLDRELWLTSRQRQVLQRHIQIVMPDHWVEPTSQVALYADWSFMTMAAAVGHLHGTWYEGLQGSQWKAFVLMQLSVSADTTSSLYVPMINGDDWEAIPSVYDAKYQVN